jgi:hypothetical protein
VSDRKQLVREVLLDRENEVSKSRREVRSLREQIARLEMALINPRSDNVAGKSKRDKVSKTHVKAGHSRSHSSSSKTRPNSKRNEDSDNDSGNDSGDVLGSGSYDESARLRRHENTWDAMDTTSRADRHISKQEAMRIVVNELRSLQRTCDDLQKEKTRLGEQVRASVLNI